MFVDYAVAGDSLSWSAFKLQSSLTSSFKQGNDDSGNEQNPTYIPISPEFSEKRPALDLLPAVQEALQSLRAGELKHNLKRSNATVSKPLVRNVLPVLA